MIQADGKTLEILSGGLSVPSSVFQQIVEIISFPFLRFIWVWFILSSWFKIAFVHNPTRLAAMNGSS